MYSFNLYHLINIVPNNIKFELLKQELIKVYMKELAYIKSTDFNRRDGAVCMATQGLIDLIKQAELPDEILKDLYIFAKEARKELGLRDNLFNIYESVLDNPQQYEKINEQINSKKKL